jgi:ribosome biogenesis protein Nip4
LDYTELITQIYRSNNFLSDFRQMSTEKIVGEESFRRTFRLRFSSQENFNYISQYKNYIVVPSHSL